MQPIRSDCYLYAVKRAILRLLILTLTLLAGWVLGYLRLPYIEKNQSFWVGFAACLVILLLVVVLKTAQNKRSTPNQNAQSDQKENTPKIRLNRSIVALVVLTLICMVLMRRLYILNESKNNTPDKVDESRFMAESMQRSQMIVLMDNVLEQIENELKATPERGISNAAIARVSALSYAFKPYRYFIGDSLSEHELSPERGQLLLALSTLGLDSGSFAKIKQKTTFAHAELRNADLSGADLSGVNLEQSDLMNVNLSSADLSRSNLSHANLWGAMMHNANLSAADLRRANLSWAELNNSLLEKANLNAAAMENTTLVGANLEEATCHWTILTGALLQKTNFLCSDLEWADLVKANLSGANLTDAHIVQTRISDANLTNVVLANTEVQKAWLEELPDRNVTGAEYISRKYEIICDSLGINQNPRYYLRRSN